MKNQLSIRVQSQAAGLVLLLVFLLAPPAGFAQPVWQSSGPACGFFEDFSARSAAGELHYLIQGGVLYKSMDAQGWREIELPRFNFAGPTLSEAILARGDSLLLSGDRGLLRSDDGGQTWSRQISAPRFERMIADPAIPGRLYGIANSVLLVSDDDGVNWRRRLIDQNNIHTLRVHPSIPGLIFVAEIAQQPMQRSDDGGQTSENVGFNQPLAGRVETFAIEPNSTSILAIDSGGRFLYADDRTGTWSQRGRLEDFDFARDVMFDPRDANRVFAIMATETDRVARVWRSLDGARTWQPVGPASASVERLDFDPTLGAIYASGQRRVLESFGDGSLWTSSSAGITTAEITDLDIDRDQGQMLAGTQNCRPHGWALRSKNDGRSWDETSVPFPFLPVEQVAFDPFDEKRWYAGTGTLTWVAITEDEGQSWRTKVVEGGASSILDELTADPFTRDRIVVSGLRTHESRDAGQTWNQIANGVAELLWHPTRAGRVYRRGFSFGERFSVSDDGGLTWTELDGPWQFFDPPNLLGFASDGALFVFDDGFPLDRIYRSTDDGQSWQQWGPDFEGALIDAAVDPTDPARVVAATEEQLWVYEGTGNWQPLSDVLEDREIRLVDFDPDNNPVVATARGVYRWSDPGSKGQCASSELSRCVQNDRFRMTLTWRDFEGGTGRGRWVDIASSESGMGWFFSPDNWEVLAKVINGCAFNGSYWVFLAATTNVEFELTVTDTETGAVKTYTNPLGEAARAVTDVGAFLGCP